MEQPKVKEPNAAVENGGGLREEQKELYFLPDSSSSQQELERLDLQHQIWTLTWDNHLNFFPAPSTTKTALDIGTGTGAWAVSFAQTHPDAQVYAFDFNIPPVATSPSCPPNVHFLIANAENPWDTWAGHNDVPAQFDYINARLLTFGMHDWKSFFALCYKHLSPGGILEVTDGKSQISNLDIEAPDSEAESPFANQRATALCRFAVRLKGVESDKANQHAHTLRGMGFEVIKTTPVRWHVGVPKGEGVSEKDKTIGEMWLRVVKMVLPTFYRMMVPTAPGMDAEKAEQLATEAIKELDEEDLSAFWTPFNAIAARKPAAA